MTHRLPDLRGLHLRHRGLTEAVCHAYAEAAYVCLSRHHLPALRDESVIWRGETMIDVLLHRIEADAAEQQFRLQWQEPDDRARRAWANLVDAVEAGAYAMAIATIEATHHWFAISRAETLTGADYYVGPPDADLESAFRLEVSGVDSGGMGVLRSRLSRKIRQTQPGRSSIPALACVVGFQIGFILVSNLEGPQ